MHDDDVIDIDLTEQAQEKVPIDEALARTGLTWSGMKKRLLKGTLRGEKVAGKWAFVYLPCQPSTPVPLVRVGPSGADERAIVPQTAPDVGLSGAVAEFTGAVQALAEQMQRQNDLLERQVALLEQALNRPPWWAFWRK